ncbi:Hypothetical predicted protein [Lecanosticta acicola]|uniref:Uncharacterized protein n=1 Tax=Lecanosticta acicola TaxID=111012 RepID=A0AAI8Z1W4_9PEZI|nr:Hypothetical predicted protein [Lecanosticta acicola]
MAAPYPTKWEPWKPTPLPSPRRNLFSLSPSKEFLHNMFEKKNNPITQAVECCFRCPNESLQNSDHGYWHDFFYYWHRDRHHPGLHSVECCTGCCVRSLTNQSASSTMLQRGELAASSAWDILQREISGFFVLWVFFTVTYYLTKWFRRGKRRVGFGVNGLVWVVAVTLVAALAPDGSQFVKAGVLLGAIVGLRAGWDFFWEELWL